MKVYLWDWEAVVIHSQDPRDLGQIISKGLWFSIRDVSLINFLKGIGKEVSYDNYPSRGNNEFIYEIDLDD